jgi:hypothetical protein
MAFWVAPEPALFFVSDLHRKAYRTLPFTRNVASKVSKDVSCRYRTNTTPYLHLVLHAEGSGGDMRKPTNFKTEYILKQDVPYHCVAEDCKETSTTEGMLRTGRVVWLDNPATDSESAESVHVYADGIGMVSVQPRFIKRVEG